MRYKLFIFAFGLLAVLSVGPVDAVDVAYVGAVDADFHAPTSLEVYPDGLAVLEPFAGQLRLFTPDGTITQKLDISKNAHALTRLSEQSFLYCDLGRKQVVAVDAVDGRQYDYLDALSGVIEPVDLVRHNDSLFVLDAGRSAIAVLNAARQVVETIVLVDELDAPIRYGSSFDYDAPAERFYVLDQNTSRILVVSRQGELESIIGGFGSHDGEITRGGEVAVGPSGNLFVADRYQGRVTVFDGNGDFVLNFGADGMAAGKLSLPTGIDIDAGGLLYVASTTGRGVHAFQVSAGQPLYIDLAGQQFPLDNATLAPKDVQLVAFTDLGETTAEPDGFEFELYAEADALVPLATSALVPADPSTGSSTITASWRPEVTFEDNGRYTWRTRLHLPDTAGEWSARRSFEVSVLPSEYRLDQNYPNPFNPSTTVSFGLPEQAHVQIEIYNLLGRRVDVLIDETLPAGNHTREWHGLSADGQPAASGVYFYRLRTDAFVKTRKMVLLK